MEQKVPAPLPKVANFVRLHFLDHPRSLGESYSEHQGHAFRFAVQLIAAGTACAIHSVIPALFARTASDTIKRLHSEMTQLGRLRAERGQRTAEASLVVDTRA